MHVLGLKSKFACAMPALSTFDAAASTTSAAAGGAPLRARARSSVGGISADAEGRADGGGSRAALLGVQVEAEVDKVLLLLPSTRSFYLQQFSPSVSPRAVLLQLRSFSNKRDRTRSGGGGEALAAIITFGCLRRLIAELRFGF